MSCQVQVLLKIDAGPEVEELMTERLVHDLRRDLLQLDVDAVEFLPLTEHPAGAKGAGIDLTQMLVSIGAAGEALYKLIGRLHTWVSGDLSRSVTLEIAGDKLVLSGVSAAEQKRLTDAWLRRHR